jgi:glycosyltransferase involved in cell wall biosynthesis
VDRRELVSFYQRCQVFVMPSLYEPVGFTGIEAMACGRPVIASNNAGLAEWMQAGDCGMLVEPGSADDLAQKLLRFLELPVATRQAMGQAARHVAENFSMERIGRQLEALYRSVLAGT